jgi:hypothetical protein
MSEYKGIKGFSIQSLSADPADPNIGQVWYNSTSGSWKVTSATTAGAWATGGNMGTSRERLGGTGTQTAGLGFGGYSPGAFAATEEYDGASWTTGGNLGTARYQLAGAGTQTAGLAFGGNPGNLANTEEYDGSTWTSGGNLNTARNGLAGAGTQTAGLGIWWYYSTCYRSNRRI